jgi:RimJ/RimL family protein N-acetyltransferase
MMHTGDLAASGVFFCANPYTLDMELELIPVQKDGIVGGINPGDSPALDEILPEITKNYTREGYVQPWVAYVAIDNGTIIGTCAFKTPPSNDRVEIAYFTFPKFENHGYATEMACRLIRIAQDTDNAITIIARTMPIEGPSASVLRKNNFEKTGEVLHPEDGLVWEWEYRGTTV